MIYSGISTQVSNCHIRITSSVFCKKKKNVTSQTLSQTRITRPCSKAADGNPSFGQGLVVPVLRSVEGMSYLDIEKGIEALGVKAREGERPGLGDGEWYTARGWTSWAGA